MRASLGIAMAGVVAAGCMASTVATASSRPPTRAADIVPARFVAVTPLAPTRLAVYSARTDRLVKHLTAPMPGGGVVSPELSADASTVVFTRGQGSCASTIDTVPANGGREHVLIPMVGMGSRAIVASNASYSADGEYLIYLTIRCSAPIDKTVHVRNLHTHRTLTGPGSLGDPAVLIHHDDQVVFLSNNGLVALRLPSLRSAVHAAPPGCRYQALTGTETELVALLQCGSRDALSIVSISLRSFDVTGTLLRLGSCLAGEDISLGATGALRHAGGDLPGMPATRPASGRLPDPDSPRPQDHGPALRPL